MTPPQSPDNFVPRGCWDSTDSSGAVDFRITCALTRQRCLPCKEEMDHQARVWCGARGRSTMNCQSDSFKNTAWHCASRINLSTDFTQWQMLVLLATEDMHASGANIFVFHVPINWTDDDFNAHFSPFGRLVCTCLICSESSLQTLGRFGQIVSAKIHVDPVTKALQCLHQVTCHSPLARVGHVGVARHPKVSGFAHMRLRKQPPWPLKE